MEEGRLGINSSTGSEVNGGESQDGGIGHKGWDARNIMNENGK